MTTSEKSFFPEFHFNNCVFISKDTNLSMTLHRGSSMPTEHNYVNLSVPDIKLYSSTENKILKQLKVELEKELNDKWLSTSTSSWISRAGIVCTISVIFIVTIFIGIKIRQRCKKTRNHPKQPSWFLLRLSKFKLSIFFSIQQNIPKKFLNKIIFKIGVNQSSKSY